MTEYLSIKDVAAQTGLSVLIVRRAVKEGALKYIRPGSGQRARYYITQQAVDEWLDAIGPGRLPRKVVP